MINMCMSDKGRELLTEWEGKERSAYNDSGGKSTVGVGHLLTAGEYYPAPLTDEQIDNLLRSDLAIAEEALNACNVRLTQNQFDALVSFIFNIGVSSFMKSTLRQKLVAGELNEVPTQLARWNKVANQVSPGLVNRRNKEISLWES